MHFCTENNLMVICYKKRDQFVSMQEAPIYIYNLNGEKYKNIKNFCDNISQSEIMN
jgi:hypothetical protein